MLHVDVKKLGNIPDGRGWRYVGKQQGRKNRAATPGKPRNAHYDNKIGTAFVHTLLDDHSRVAYAEIHDDGSCYRSNLWRDTCTELGITPKKTRPYRPQTNGKIDRFHRTLADGCAFKQLYLTEQDRRDALPAWLHHYNHHRPHTAIGKSHPSPASPTSLISTASSVAGGG